VIVCAVIVWAVLCGLIIGVVKTAFILEDNVVGAVSWFYHRPNKSLNVRGKKIVTLCRSSARGLSASECPDAQLGQFLADAMTALSGCCKS